jgi:hypothetical protein
MFREGLNELLDQAAPPSPSGGIAESATAQTLAYERELFRAGGTFADRSARPRRTPRMSVIVVIPENHVVSPELVAERLPATGEQEVVDVIVACAGQPANLSALQRKVRHLRVLLVPAGTSTEDLRELAMKQAPGDIVTLLGGLVVSAARGDREISTTV